MPTELPGVLAGPVGTAGRGHELAAADPGRPQLAQVLLPLGMAGGGPGRLVVAVPGRRGEQLVEPVPLGAQLPGRHPPQVHQPPRVAGQGRRPVAAHRRRQPLIPIHRRAVVGGVVEVGGALLGAGDGVDAGQVAGPAEHHKQPLGVLPAGHKRQRGPLRQPLGLVPRGRIGQVHPGRRPWAVPPVQVAGRQGHGCPLGRAAALGVGVVADLDGQRPRLGVDCGDGPAGAVGDLEAGEGVLAAHHPIPHRDTPPRDLKTVGAELAGVGPELLAGSVEPLNVLAAVGQDHHVLPRLVGLPPVVQQPPGQLGGGLGQHHPVVLPVERDRLLDLEAADQLEGLLLPGGVLAAVDGQLAGAEP